MKLLHLFLALFTATFFLACSSDKEQLQVETNLTTYSEDMVALQASGALAYSWRQLSGTPVVLINANTATPSFIAPSVSTEETLVFELEAVTVQFQNKNITLKKQVQVTVHPKVVSADSTDMNSTSGEVELEEQSNETNTSTNETNTTQPTVSLKSLKLTLEKNSLNVDETTTLKVVANYEDNTTKDVTNEVEWNLSDTTAAQITQKSLHAKKDTNIFLQAKLGAISSNTLALEIYKEINGHRLPPEPDPAVNNATLLGIDSNDNGVRDDVERKIYTYYEKPIEHAVIMQSARAYQIVIQEPEKALENLHYILDASDCESYWSMSEEDAKSQGEAFWLEEYKNYSKEMKPVQFNTADRFLAYKKFNQTLSGGVYSSSSLNEWKNRCDFNSSTLIKNP